MLKENISNPWLSQRTHRMSYGIFLFCFVLLYVLTSHGFLSAAEQEILKGGFPSFKTPLPQSSQQWDVQKIELRKKLWRLLGDMPPLFTPKPEIDKSESRDGYTLEHFTFDNGVGDTVYGYILIPVGRTEPGPAILYNHYHGGQYQQGKEELITKAFKTLDFATGEALAKEGYVVLGIDAYAFGQRRFQGPAGQKEEGRNTEWSLFKTFLLEGKSLWGMIVRDDLLALNYLISRPEVDPNRIATMGMSMGSNRSWWAAAMDDRIKVTVSVVCLSRYQDLIAHGSVGSHRFYFYVPSMLAEKIDVESVVGLITPRPFLAMTGDMDRLSPVDGVQIIYDFQENLYKLYEKPENFRGLMYPGVGHEYTPEMWKETIDWLKRHL
jgi:dienelactone hydrolase